MTGLSRVAGAVIEEVTGAIPRVIERTHAQMDILQRLFAALPCVARDRSGDDPSRPVLVSLPVGAASEDGSADDAAPQHAAPEDESKEADLQRRADETTSPEVTVLAIPDYDSLAASQVVPRLPSLDASELADIGDYERAHRSRQTIINRVRQLQADAGAG